eukprot:12421390-Alexandrium_andersonii.AAC.1
MGDGATSPVSLGALRCVSNGGNGSLLALDCTGLARPDRHRVLSSSMSPRQASPGMERLSSQLPAKWQCGCSTLSGPQLAALARALAAMS